MATHRWLRTALLLGGLGAAAPIAAAQDPDDTPPGRPDGPANASDLVARMMKFDQDKDGKLARAEITDARMVRLFARADADKDGTVTAAELAALEAAEKANMRGGFGGPGGPGGPPPGGPGGMMGGPGGMMGMPPRPGEVLPEMMRGRLKLTAEQKLRLDELQRDVDARMAKILTDDQKAQLKQMAARGPGGPGGPGGPPPGGRGRGGPGGPPPGGPGDDGPPR